jgi:hypothetical protein
LEPKCKRYEEIRKEEKEKKKKTRKGPRATLLDQNKNDPATQLISPEAVSSASLPPADRCDPCVRAIFFLALIAPAQRILPP